MKLLLLFLVMGNWIHKDAPELSTLRKLYYRAAVESAASVSLSKELKSVQLDAEPILVCYKGAAYMMEAKYAFNPISKLSRFSKGKNAIEHAIAREPSNMEMRFIRFSIQTNLPGFLGYHTNISSDKQKLLAGVGNLKDKTLKDNITAYLIASKKCTSEEIKKLQQ
ncbi:hypothetical protein [Pedobacter boryungensis]|uniref:Uncharacterized protein n=1 Tax=Pedobacter boryungensis TaxID=869962 RepID=A0ABX2DBB7_9SPHI|nr:hypothetical protein [Pedobacter boryungensis]NQX30621.1 hypothetical protein [Pedobacter boryungensis]